MSGLSILAEVRVRWRSGREFRRSAAPLPPMKRQMAMTSCFRNPWCGTAIFLGIILGTMICFPTVGSAQAGAKEKTTGKSKSVSRGKDKEAAEIPGIQEFTSKNFVLRTDLSTEEARELLTRLETMLVLVSRYFGKPNAQIIEMNVVKQRSNWPAGSIDPDAMQSIESGAGITLSVTSFQRDGSGQKQVTGAKSIVWAVADRGTPQHEAVHAYCHQSFGRTGPTWYSEGMAELGQYWREKEDGVNIHDGVLKYLKSQTPKELTEIVAPGQRTGDSWENYSWRWALCHLLAANPNYSARFKPLGLALLNDQETSFEMVYGPMAKEITFEYMFFLNHLDQGYRADLCAWDWKTKFQRLKGTGSAQAKIDAIKGWQPSRVLVKSGDKISFSTTGEWSLSKSGKKVTAAGHDDGKGKLLGILFEDYQLSEPFELGDIGEWEAPGDGNLFLRCADDWNSLADNGGSVSVKLKAAK